jgi:ligand-binding sensor protein
LSVNDAPSVSSPRSFTSFASKSKIFNGHETRCQQNERTSTLADFHETKPNHYTSTSIPLMRL